MPNYAIHDGTQVINSIVASSEEVVAELFPGSPFFDIDEYEIANSKKDKIDEIEYSFIAAPSVGWIFIDGQWLPPRNNESDMWNGYFWEQEGSQ